MAGHPELFKKVETLQNMLVALATSGEEWDAAEYKTVRGELLNEPLVNNALPGFVRACRDGGQFWGFIKNKFSTYAERRHYLWGEFQPVLDRLERLDTGPAEEAVAEALEKLDETNVRAIWSRALDRRVDDPEGAITLARTLLEEVCKHILDDRGVEYPENADLPRLYRTASTELGLAPSQHTERVFKQILGGCTAVVEGLGAVRNRLGDAHGGGKSKVRPAARHAELAVNLSGAMALFLVATAEARRSAEGETT